MSFNIKKVVLGPITRAKLNAKQRVDLLSQLRVIKKSLKSKRKWMNKKSFFENYEMIISVGA